MDWLSVGALILLLLLASAAVPVLVLLGRVAADVRRLGADAEAGPPYPVAMTAAPFNRTTTPTIHQCVDPRLCPVCTPPEQP